MRTLKFQNSHQEAPKWPTGSVEVLRRSCQLSINKFFDARNRSIRKGYDGGFTDTLRTPSWHFPDTLKRYFRQYSNTLQTPTKFQTCMVIPLGRSYLTTRDLNCSDLTCPTKPVLNSPVLSGPVINWPVLTWPFLTWPVLTWPVLIWPVLTWPILTWPILTWPILTSLVLTYQNTIKTSHRFPPDTLKTPSRHP